MSLRAWGSVFAAALLCALLPGCKVSDLVGPQGPSPFTVSPSPLAQTLVSGMGDVVTVGLHVTSADSSGQDVPWVARVQNGGPWIALGSTGGTAPGIVTLTLSPGDTAPGDYSATLVFEDRTGAAVTHVPVRLQLVSSSNAARTAGCVVLKVPADATVSGSITSDCMSTTQPSRYTRVFQFDGASGDTVTLSASSPDLGPRISLFAPNDWPGGSTIALVKDCNGSGTGTQACLTDFVLPETGTYTVEIWPWEMNWGGSFAFKVDERGAAAGGG